MKKSDDYKRISVNEFTKAADMYESNNAGVYNICKKDYPDILEEIRKEPFTDLLDAGCGTAPMISLLVDIYPEAHFTGIDITPKMIEIAKNKSLPNTTFVCGDCENLPFDDNSFDVIICDTARHDSRKRYRSLVCKQNRNAAVEFIWIWRCALL